MSEHVSESGNDPVSTENQTQTQTPGDAVADQAIQAALEVANAEHSDQLLRIRADSENFKRRIQQDKETAVKYALEGFIRDLIPILDSFDQAMAFADQSKENEAKENEASSASIVSGFALIQQQVVGLLEKSSVVLIQADGEFDPHCHQAISQVASDTVPANYIVQVAQTGYAYYDRIVRPAMVIVSTGPATDSLESKAITEQETEEKKLGKEI